jgi:hypothetical protein
LYDREVYMVEQRGELPEKTTKELDKAKGHNGLQDDSEGSEDEHMYGAPTRRHHPKFNS